MVFMAESLKVYVNIGYKESSSRSRVSCCRVQVGIRPFPSIETQRTTCGSLASRFRNHFTSRLGRATSSLT